MKIKKPIFNSYLIHENEVSWRDIILLIILILLLWFGIIALKGMSIPLNEMHGHIVDLDPKNISNIHFSI